MSSASGYPPFPEGDALAQAFFGEGLRHLEDAQILHKAGRYPAAIASAMKAAELGVKSIIILGGAMGWWDRVFTTHSPLGDISGLPIFEHHIQTITAYNGTLVSDVMVMEKLAPAKPGGSYDIGSQQNPEYPFLSYQRALGTNPGEFRLNKPSMHFGEADSRRYYNTAQDLLTAVATQYATVSGWVLAIPDAV